MLKKIGKLTLLLLITLHWLSANNVAFSADVDKKSIPLNQTITLTLSVDGSINVPGITLPAIEGFTVIGQSTSTHFQMVNGNQFINKAFSYTLQPTSQGIKTIPSMSLKFANKHYSTNPIKVKVTAPAKNNQPIQNKISIDNFFNLSHFRGTPPSNKIKVRMTASKKQLYVGEKAIVTIEFYSKRPVADGPAFDFPKLEGFIIKTLNNSTKASKTDYNNEKYLLISASKEVTPVNKGIYNIKGATVRYLTGAYSGVESKKTNSLSLTVKPLPLNAPDNFSGAVGVFKLTAKMNFNKTQIKQGDSIPLIINISGKGNLDMINSLQLPDFSGFDIYLDTITEDTHKIKSATKTFKYQLTPISVQGPIQLPNIKFSYFNPHTNKYVYSSAQLPSIKIKENSNFSSQNNLNNNINATDNTLVIRLNRQFIANIFEYLKRILLIALAIIVIGSLLYFGKSYFFSANSLLKKQLQKLDHTNNNEFMDSARNLLEQIVLRKYHTNLTGISSTAIAETIKHQESAVLIKELLTIFEQYKYSLDKELGNNQRENIQQKLATLMKSA